eukprot:Clim_evm24s51 gene=Clim_evmTU24s51
MTGGHKRTRSHVPRGSLPMVPPEVASARGSEASVNESFETSLQAPVNNGVSRSLVQVDQIELPWENEASTSASESSGQPSALRASVHEIPTYSQRLKALSTSGNELRPEAILSPLSHTWGASNPTIARGAHSRSRSAAENVSSRGSDPKSLRRGSSSVPSIDSDVSATRSSTAGLSIPVTASELTGPNGTDPNGDQKPAAVAYTITEEKDDGETRAVDAMWIRFIELVETFLLWLWNKGSFGMVLGISIFTILPSLFIAAYFSIPLAEPTEEIDDQLVWLLFTMPVSQVLISYILMVLFLGSLDDALPWRPLEGNKIILVVVYFVQVIVFVPVLFYDVGSFAFTGIVNVALTFIVTILGLRFMPVGRDVMDPKRYREIVRRYIYICITIFIFICMLGFYIIAFREAGSGFQRILVLALSFALFMFKKALLAIGDSLPIEMAMLIAGMWLENLDDVLQTMAYPNVDEPGGTFTLILAVKFLENVAYMFFLTRLWFRFRIWIKNALKYWFQCKKPPTVEPIEEDIIDDRGHSNVRLGYLRRQIRFLGFKVLSQISAAVFYLITVPVLTKNANAKYFPYGDQSVDRSYQDEVHLNQIPEVLPDEALRNSYIFAGVSIFVLGGCGLACKWYITTRMPEQISREMYRVMRLVCLSPLYLGFVMLIFLSNMMLATGFMEFHQRVYYF